MPSLYSTIKPLQTMYYIANACLRYTVQLNLYKQCTLNIRFYVRVGEKKLVHKNELYIKMDSSFQMIYFE